MKNLKQTILILLLFIAVSACDTNKDKTIDTPPPPPVEEPTSPVVEQQLTAEGEITGASYKNAAGEVIKMSIVKNTSDKVRTSTITFYKGDAVILTMNNGVISTLGNKRLGQLYSTVVCEGVNYRCDIDASTIAVTTDEPSKGEAKVTAKLGEKTWEGTLDFSTSKLYMEEAPNVNDLIPSDIVKMIEPFSATLTDATNYYYKKTGYKLTGAVIGQPIWASLVGSLCRAACCAAGAALATGCPVTGPGAIACLAAVAAWTSLCVDACPA